MAPTNVNMHGSAHGKVEVCFNGRIPSYILNNGSSAWHMAAKTSVFRSEFLLLSPLGSGSNQDEILQRGEQQDRCGCAE